MKKIALLLSVLIMLFIAGCSSTGKTNMDSSNTNNVPESKETKILLDDENYFVEYKGIAEHSESSWIIDLLIQNKTGTEIQASLSDSCINSYSFPISNNFANIPANSNYVSSANFDFVIDKDDLELYDIELIKELSFNLKIKTDMFGDDLASASATLNPNKKVNIENKANFSNDETIIDTDNCLVKYLGIYKHSDSTFIVNLYAENKSDKEICIDIDDFLVNGNSISLSNNNNSLQAGKKYMAAPKFDYVFDADKLKPYNVDSIKTVSFTVKVKNDFIGDSIGETKVSYNVNIPVPDKE